MKEFTAGRYKKPRKIADIFRLARPWRILCCVLLAPTCFAQSLAQSPDTPLSLNFQSIDVRAALQILAEYGGVNLVVSDSVSGDLTLRLDQTHWREALELILISQGLKASERSGALIVTSAADSTGDNLHTRVFSVQYAEAEDIKALLQLRGEASCLVDDRTNALIVTDTLVAIEEHRALIDRLDVPIRQVLIEARVVVASVQASEQLGVRWLGSASKRIGGEGELRVGGTPSGSEPSEGEAQPLVDLGIGLPGASRFGLGFSGSGAQLDVEISALETSGEAEIIARPRVVTASRSTALVRSGVQIPYQESTSSGATSTSFQSAALSLQVTPRITSEENVILVLKVTQDTVGRTYSGIPSINTNAIETEVLVKDGETLVLGGVYQEDLNKAVSQTPVLGKVPVLGRLFRRTISSDDKRELLVFLTPTVLP